MGRSRQRHDQGEDRRWQTKVSTILAPINADQSDIDTHPPLIEAERIRRGAIGLRRDLARQGASGRDIHDAVVAWIGQQPTPVCDALGIGLGLLP